MYALLADLIVALHLFYVGFVVLGLVFVLLGAVLGWRWTRNRRFRITHLVCTLIVPVEALCGVLCPLTQWEHDLRAAAGQDPEEVSFVARLVREILFWEAPAWVFTAAYVAFGLAVLAAFRWLPPRPRSRTPVD